MPLFKQERTITIYAEAESPMDLIFGSGVDLSMEKEKPNYKIFHWSENIGLAKEVPQKEYDQVREQHLQNMKCPSE
jgi:hypothetical protein